MTFENQLDRYIESLRADLDAVKVDRVTEDDGKYFYVKHGETTFLPDSKPNQELIVKCRGKGPSDSGVALIEAGTELVHLNEGHTCKFVSHNGRWRMA